MSPCRSDYVIIRLGCAVLRDACPYSFRIVVEPSLTGSAASCLREVSLQFSAFAHPGCPGRELQLIHYLASSSIFLFIHRLACLSLCTLRNVPHYVRRGSLSRARLAPAAGYVFPADRTISLPCLLGLGSFHFESAWTLLPHGIVSEPSPCGAWLLIGISSEPFQQLKSSSLPVSR